MSCFIKRVCMVGMLAVALMLAACGEEAEQLDCGEGTDLQDGQCVVSEHDCDDGDVVAPSGDCVDPASFCDEEGAVYDSSQDECIADTDVTCGAGTVEDDGVCIVENPTHCGEGTVLADGSCELSDELCGPGTELDEQQCQVSEDACQGRAEYDVVNEECVVLEEIECGEDTIEDDDFCVPYSSFADELADEADIDYTDGDPIVPDAEETFVFTGTMDQQLEQTFELEGTEGEWLEITIYQRGLPSPGFQLDGPIGNWQRAVLAGLTSTPTRTVVTPADGAMDLTVDTSLTDHEQSESFGDESWKYVGTVEVIDTPDTTSWDFEDDDLSGDFSDSVDNWYDLDVEGFDEIFLTPNTVGEDVSEGTVELWSTSGQLEATYDLEEGEQVELDVFEYEELHMHVDARHYEGPRSDFEMDARGTVRLESGDLYDHYVDVDAGETILISHRSDQADDARVRIFRDGEFQQTIEEVGAENQSNFGTADSQRQYFYAEEADEYLLEFQNINDHELTSFISTSSTDDVPFINVPDEGTASFDAWLGGEDLYQGDWRIVFVDTKSPARLTGTKTSGDYGLTPDVALYSPGGEMLQSAGSSGGDVDFDFTVPEAGTHFIAVQPRSTFSTAGDIEIEMDTEAIEVLEPNETTERTFEVDGFDVLTGGIDYDSGPEPTVRLTNPNGSVVFEEQEVDSMNFAEIFPGPGEYTLEVINPGDENILALAVDAVSSSPFDILDVDSDFAESYSRSAIDEGERDTVIFQPQSDYIFDYSVIFDEDEEGVVRVRDVDTREVLIEEEGDQRIDLESESIESGTFILEFDAVTDVDDYNITFSGNDITFREGVRSYDPPLEIAQDGGFESTTLGVDDCNNIADVSMSMDMPSGTSSQITIFLYAPGLTEPILVFEEDFSGDLTTTYPDDQEPIESFSPMINTPGTGVWSLDIINDSGTTTAELAEWSVNLVCEN